MSGVGWFTANEMAGFRQLAEVGMTTPVDIYKRSVNVDSDPTQVYGTVAETFTYTETVGGWVYSTPSPVITQVAGTMALVNTYRLFLPVGTDCTSGDRCLIEGNWFIVSDTIEESTWLPLLRLSLRRVE